MGNHNVYISMYVCIRSCIHMYMTSSGPHGPYLVNGQAYYGRIYQKTFFFVRFEIGILVSMHSFHIRRRRVCALGMLRYRIVERKG